jgi:hypothetical protein
MIRSDYSVALVTDDIVFITDDWEAHGRMSVTNDAENVVQHVNGQYPGRRIVYRDTDGCWDELLHADGNFTGFAPYRGMVP